MFYLDSLHLCAYLHCRNVNDTGIQLESVSKLCWLLAGLSSTRKSKCLKTIVDPPDVLPSLKLYVLSLLTTSTQFRQIPCLFSQISCTFSLLQFHVWPFTCKNFKIHLFGNKYVCVCTFSDQLEWLTEWRQSVQLQPSSCGHDQSYSQQRNAKYGRTSSWKFARHLG